jgi:hypothetical protein
MRYLYLFSLIAVWATNSFAQDLIVKSGSDSVNAKIVGEDSTNLYIATYRNNVEIHTFMEKENVLAYNYGYYKRQKPSIENGYNIKFDVNFGIGYLIAPAPDNITKEHEQYIDEMRQGMTYDLNLNVFITKVVAVGLKYNRFSTSNSIGSIIEDNINIDFIGPSFIAYMPLVKNNSFFYTNFSIGKISEKNKGKIMGDDFEVKGSSVGVYSSIGFDVLLTRNISLGLQSGLMLGSIDKFYVNDVEIELDEPDNLARIDIMVGLKIYL